MNAICLMFCFWGPVGCKSIPEEGRKGRGLQDRDQEPRAHHRAMHETKQHDRHIRGGCMKQRNTIDIYEVVA